MPEPVARLCSDTSAGHVRWHVSQVCGEPWHWEKLSTLGWERAGPLFTEKQLEAYAAAREAAAVEPLAKFLQQHEDLWPFMSGSAVKIAIAVIEKLIAEREQERERLRAFFIVRDAQGGNT